MRLKILKPKTYHLKPKKGQVMILTVMILGGIILGATTIAGLLMIYQIRQSTNVKHSTMAIFAADAGVEYYLYYYPGVTVSSTLDNKATFEVIPTPTGAKSTGQYQNSLRAFEINFGP